MFTILRGKSYNKIMPNLISKLPKIARLKPDMAGAIMLPLSQIPLTKTTDTISKVEKNLLEKIKELDTINYIYIVDDGQKLKGVISVKEIFRQPKETLVSEIMEEKLVRARLHTDQERVAFLAIKYNLKAIPVVDKTDKLLGVVSSDTILDILNKEATEDILHLAGVQRFDTMAIDVTKTPSKAIIWARLPWLIAGLIGGILAARILGFFEATLETQIVFAFFIPVMLYMSNAVAIQSQTMFIRSLTVDPQLKVRTYFSKEIKIGGFIALVCALLLSLIFFLWQASPFIGIILGLSMFISTTWAVILAIFIPWLLRKFKKDPAVGSGPFGTILNDVSTLIIYFSIVSLMIRIFLS